MSAIALHLYEQLTEAPDDKAKAKIIAETLSQLEDHFAAVGDVATRSQVRETELRLQKEIKEAEVRLHKELKEIEAQLRKEIKEIEAELRKDIEQVRLEIKQTEASLQKEIDQVRLEIKNVELKLQQTEIRLLSAIHRQTYWVIGSVGTIIGFIRLLDWLLAKLPG